MVIQRELESAPRSWASTAFAELDERELVQNSGMFYIEPHQVQVRQRESVYPPNGLCHYARPKLQKPRQWAIRTGLLVCSPVEVCASGLGGLKALSLRVTFTTCSFAAASTHYIALSKARASKHALAARVISENPFVYFIYNNFFFNF